MAMKRSNFPKALEPGVRRYFGEGYRKVDPTWKTIFETKNTERAWEEDTLMTGFGLAEEIAEGGSTPYDAMIEGWSKRYIVAKYGMGVVITEEAIDDNRYMKLTQKAGKHMGRSMAETADIVHAGVFNNAFSSAHPGGDGVALCSTAHPLLGRGAGVMSNKLSVAADFSEAALEQAVIQISLLRDDRGLAIGVNPVRVIHHPNLQFVVARTLKSDLRPGTGDNDINAIKSAGILQNAPVQWRHLADPNAWFIQTDADDGLIHYKRKGLTPKSWGDENTGNWHSKITERYALGWTDPRCIFGSEGVSNPYA